MFVIIALALALGVLLHKRYKLDMLTSAAAAIVGTAVVTMAFGLLERFQVDVEFAPAALANGRFNAYPERDALAGAMPYLTQQTKLRYGAGDPVLTNLYRRLHNLEAIQRGEIFQFNDALAGGDHGISRERYSGEAYDRERMAIQKEIRERIAATRRPYDEAYDVPTKPLLCNYTNGTSDSQDCQWQADSEGLILGIPSQVGSQPMYY